MAIHAVNQIIILDCACQSIIIIIGIDGKPLTVLTGKYSLWLSLTGLLHIGIATCTPPDGLYKQHGAKGTHHPVIDTRKVATWISDSQNYKCTIHVSNSFTHVGIIIN